MKIIPVIDVLGGRVVHAVRGRRKEYQPLKSILCASTDPVDVAVALKALGFGELYVADLDAITRGQANFSIFKNIADKTGLELMVDAGIDDLKKAESVLESHVSKVIIGDRGTDSPALYDHKAFLFDREKELLVIPVNLFEISDEIKEQYDDDTGSMYGEFMFQGAFVYRLSLENGFEYKGRITHLDDEDILKSGYYGYWDSSSISRSLYIDDILYTISNNKIKMNSLETLSEINSIKLV